MYLRNAIKDMVEGQTGYTLAWAVCKEGGSYYLHPDYPVYSEPIGTADMYIEKVKGRYYCSYSNKVGGNGFVFPTMTLDQLIKTGYIK